MSLNYISDQTSNIVQIIALSAPERETELSCFLRANPVRFLKVEDRTGIVMNATSEHVKYAHKDLQVVWLLGFSLWKAIHLFAPAILGPTHFGRSSGFVIDTDEDLDGFERDYRERLAYIAQVIKDKTLNLAVWPPDIPEPVASRDDLSDIQDKLVYDTVIMATAVLFLHELRHAKFDRDDDNGIPRPIRREEERLCDEHARDWFISKHDRYATEHGYDPQKVCSKRAIALLIVCEFLRFTKDHAGIRGAALYPPLADRIAVLSGSLPLPDTDDYWVVSSCVLFAEARRRHVPELELPAGSPKAISEHLLQRLHS